MSGYSLLAGLRSAVVALLLAGAALYGYPLLGEGASNVCSALEKKIIRSAPDQPDAGTLLIVSVLQRTSNGDFAARMNQQNYPNLPPQLGCLAAYYGGQATLTPDQLRDAAAAQIKTQTEQAVTGGPIPGVTPSQPKPAVPAGNSGYKPDDTKSMDQLIKSNQ